MDEQQASSTDASHAGIWTVWYATLIIETRIDPFLPPDQRPSLLSKPGLAWRLQYWKSTFNSTVAYGVCGRVTECSVARLKINLRQGWTPRRFVQEATELYGQMNTAFAEGNVKTLQKICEDDLASEVQKLKGEIKARSGRFQWSIQPKEQPRVETVRVAQLGPSFLVGQVTVRFHTLQSIAVYNKKDQLIAGDPNHQHDVVEHVVFQRLLSLPTAAWKIYTKLTPKKAL